jgi:hypothetical protein
LPSRNSLRTPASRRPAPHVRQQRTGPGHADLRGSRRPRPRLLTDSDAACWPYYASVEIRAVERWLDEGWTPWRVAYGSASLISLVVAVYGYAVHPRHLGWIVWTLICVIGIAVWALLEASRWRIKYRRLARSQHAALPEGQQPIGKLLAAGKSLEANIGNHMAWWGTDRLLPKGIPERLTRWGSDVAEALIIQPEIRALFQNAPSVDAKQPISGQAYGRLEYQLRVLNSLTVDGTLDSGSNLSESDAGKVRAGLVAYYSERDEKLRELHERGHELRISIDPSADPDVEARLNLVQGIQNWEASVRTSLMYWPDLNRFDSIITFGGLPLPSIGEIRDRIQQELEVLRIARKRSRELSSSILAAGV